MMVLKGSIEHLLNGGLDAVGLLILGADAERAFREEACAAQERELFKNESLAALVDGCICGGKAAETAADD